MATVLAEYSRYSRRQKRKAAQVGKRLDVQGLRMVAVLTVFANHLWGQPSGGFIGVDVFFVISGFLITSNLMRMAETQGNVSFRRFYWNRVRRIVPAATVVLLLTVGAAFVLFLPFRAREVGVDAGWAFVFLSNWWFSYNGTDYFRAAADTVSPLQHYWSLSVEEQFYFIWPALIFVIGLMVAKRSWDHQRRMTVAGIVMTTVIAASFAWSISETITAPVAAYFNTFARIWELGVGALLACVAGALTHIPALIRTALSWTGLALIAVALFLISDESHGFPAPWAALPVIGAALVIIAGIGAEPQYQAVLRNPVSGYIGDISYSLYLVHWPVIVLLGTLMDAGLNYSLTAIGLAFGLAVASYHFVENPFRHGTWMKFLDTAHGIRRRRFAVDRSTQVAGVAAGVLIVAALLAYLAQPRTFQHATPPVAAAVPSQLGGNQPNSELGPFATELSAQIDAALKAESWPQLEPSMEAVIDQNSDAAQPGIPGCGGVELVSRCSWGADDAPIKVVIGGNSVGVYYAAALKNIAEESRGQIQVHTEAMPGCNFIADTIYTADSTYAQACPGRKQQFVDYINRTKPSVVVLAHNYVDKKIEGTDHELAPTEWAASMNRFIEQFSASAAKVAIVAPPPGDVQISDCYSKRGSVPADCIGEVTQDWLDMAEAERAMIKGIKGAWIDSRPWFCSKNLYCPSFVGSTPTKLDRSHMVAGYGLKISPVIDESFIRAGVFPA